MTLAGFLHLAGYFAIAVPILAALAYAILWSVGWYGGNEIQAVDIDHQRRMK